MVDGWFWADDSIATGPTTAGGNQDAQGARGRTE